MDNPKKPDNYMVWAILSTAFCCLPLGLVSIISASKVNRLYREGNYEEAQKSADMAKKFALISAVLGFVGSIAYFALTFMGMN